MAYYENKDGHYMLRKSYRRGRTTGLTGYLYKKGERAYFANYKKRRRMQNITETNPVFPTILHLIRRRYSWRSTQLDKAIFSF